MSQDAELPRRYAIRIQPRAERDINANIARLEDFGDPRGARDWYDGLFHAISTLSENPRRCPVVKENRRFRREVRQLLFRRTPGGPAWRILFTVDDGGEDAPTVTVIHVRHGAQRPITRAEARELEAEQ